MLVCLLALTWVFFLSFCGGHLLVLPDFLHRVMPLSHRAFWIPLGLNFAMSLFATKLCLIYNNRTPTVYWSSIIFEPHLHSPYPLKLFTSQCLSLFSQISSPFVQVYSVCGQAWLGGQGCCSVAKSKEVCQGSLFFRMLLRVTAVTPSGGVYYLNKQDDQKDQQKRTSVIRTSACFRACATDCSCFVSLSELEGGR